MSSLKRSSTCHDTYATGSDGEKELINSLDLLLFLKGKEYNKKFPDFIIPSAKEFLGFARIVSDNTYDKSRKTIAIAKYHNGASKQSVKKILQARPFLLSPMDGGTRRELLEFLNYIHSNRSFIVSNSVLMCLSTVLYAVSLYTFMNSCLGNLECSPDMITKMATCVFVEDGAKNMYNRPILRFCTTHMPILCDYKLKIANGSHTFLKEYTTHELAVYFSEYEFPADALTGVLASVTAAGLERYYVQHPTFKKLLFKPLVESMYESGIRI